MQIYDNVNNTNKRSTTYSLYVKSEFRSRSIVLLILYWSWSRHCLFVCGCILTMVGGARNWLNIVCYVDGAARHGANVPGKRNGGDRLSFGRSCGHPTLRNMGSD